MSWKGVFFSSKGRIGRHDYWVGILLLALLNVCLGLLGWVGLVLAIPLAYPQICLFAKRLHDLGKSGWRTLIPIGAVVLGGFVASAVEGADPDSLDALPFQLIAAGLMIFSVVYSLRVGLKRGQPEANAYGEPVPPVLKPRSHAVA